MWCRKPEQLSMETVMESKSRRDAHGMGLSVSRGLFYQYTAVRWHLEAFDAETFAIMRGTHFLASKRQTGHDLHRLSGSYGKNSVRCPRPMSEHGDRNHRTTLKVLRAGNTLTIRWVPGHKGVTGNEVADTFAKRQQGEENLQPNPKSKIRTTLRTP